jgi:hypothetical protein
MIKRQKLIALILGWIMVCSISATAYALEWGSKEMETEKLAVQFANQVSKCGYGIVTSEELKAWIVGFDERRGPTWAGAENLPLALRQAPGRLCRRMCRREA